MPIVFPVRNESLAELMHPVERHLRRPGVRDACFQYRGELWLDLETGWTCIKDSLLTAEWAYKLLDAIAIEHNIVFNWHNPYLSAVLEGGIQVAGAKDPACIFSMPVIVFRLPTEIEPSSEPSLEDLAHAPPRARKRHPRKLAWTCASATWNAVRKRQNILIAGPRGAGQVHQLKRCLRRASVRERIVTLEERHQLIPFQRNTCQLMYGPNTGAIPASAAIAQALLMRCDRLVLDEIRGAEAFEVIRLLLSGQRGMLTTVNAKTLEMTSAQVALLAAGHREARAFSHATLVDLVERSFDVILWVERNRQGRPVMSNVKCYP